MVIQPLNSQPGLLPFVFALAETLEHGEPGLFRVRDGERFELVRRIEGGNDFAHRLFARRTMRQRLGRKRPAQREFPAAGLAAAFAQLVFVKRHKLTTAKSIEIFPCRRICLNIVGISDMKKPIKRIILKFFAAFIGQIPV